jgi:hypothetical protein
MNSAKGFGLAETYPKYGTDHFGEKIEYLH